MMNVSGLLMYFVSPGDLKASLAQLKPHKLVGTQVGYVMQNGSHLLLPQCLKNIVQTYQLKLQSELAPPGSEGSCFSFKFQRQLLTAGKEPRSLSPTVSLRDFIPCSGVG